MSKPKSKPICRECAHYQEGWAVPDRCVRYKPAFNLIDGNHEIATVRECWAQRNPILGMFGCGPSGRNFEPIKPAKVKAKAKMARKK